MSLNFFKTWLPIILWMGVIFYLSHQPDLKSGLGDWLDFILRKIAHITEYAILTFLLIRASKNLPVVRHGKKWSFLTAFIYACSDEYHQLFVYGRHGSPADIAIDSIGMILVILFCEKISKILKKLKIYVQPKKASQ